MSTLYAIAGELESGCVHYSGPITRESARRFVKRYAVHLLRRPGWAEFRLNVRRVALLPPGYRYRRVRLIVRLDA